MSETKALTTLFDYRSSQVRVIMRGETPWFVAIDVCQVLGISNHHDAISRLKPTEKDWVGISDAIGRTRPTTIIPEYALYKLAFRSNKPEAEAFTDWVASEVLPAIRKTGTYSIQSPAPQLIDVLVERLLLNVDQIPDGYFAVSSELLRNLALLKDKLDHSTLDALAKLDQSIAQRFLNDCGREELEKHRTRYTHLFPSGKSVPAWAYECFYLTMFTKWLWGVYFPIHFPAYEQYRARHLGLPAPKRPPRKLIAAAANQLPLFRESGARQ
jgi:prophage antirepressor-like protein